MFVGRKAELQFLERKYNEEGGQLIFLYGRRRVGKTETLRQFCKDKSHVFFSCRECSDRLQLANFSKHLLQENIPAKKYLQSFADWEQALQAILELPYGEAKKLVVIDEFPYMCKGNASIPSILQNLWDSLFKDANVMLVLCGSAMSFIEKELLSEKNPLYGRATGIYKMLPLDFYDACEFFPEYSDLDKILTYAILGGIPYYLQQFKPQLSLAENIKKNILSKGCVLYSEIEFLLHQELRETSLYNSLLEAIALGNTKLNEISQKALVNDLPKTNIYLKNLMELGLVQREFSVDVGNKERSNRNKGIYRLTDNFFRFWYAFVFANYTDLELGDVEGVYKYVVAPELSRFASFAFEDICKEFVFKLQLAGKLPFRYRKLGRWFGKTTIRQGETVHIAETEIDFLAISRQGDAYLVGECKFKNKPFSYGEYLDVKAKLQPEQVNHNFYYALFSASGFDEKLRALTEGDSRVMLYDLKEIVNAFNLRRLECKVIPVDEAGVVYSELRGGITHL